MAGVSDNAHQLPADIETLHALMRMIEEKQTLVRLLNEYIDGPGLTVVIGSPANPYGVLGAHSPERRVFAEDDVNFLQAVANVLAAARERQNDEEQDIDAERRDQTAGDQP